MVASEADRQLVDRIRAGEADAWQQCIDLYEGRLLAFARTRLQDRSAAEDIVQETFLGFLKALPNYDDRTPLESWLFSIAAHKLIDFMLRPEVAAANTNFLRFANAVATSGKFIDPVLLTDPGLYPPPSTLKKISAMTPISIPVEEEMKRIWDKLPKE